MLWLIVILLIGALSFVIFHKPHVNAMGAGWTPPERRVAPAQPASFSAEDAVTLRLSRKAPVDGAGAEFDAEDAVTTPVPLQAPQTPDTFDFNDLFGGTQKAAPTDRPQA